MRKEGFEMEAGLDNRKGNPKPPLLSKPERRRFAGAFLVAALLILAGAFKSKGAELRPETINAWNEYVRSQDARVNE